MASVSNEQLAAELRELKNSLFSFSTTRGARDGSDAGSRASYARTGLSHSALSSRDLRDPLTRSVEPLPGRPSHSHGLHSQHVRSQGGGNVEGMMRNHRRALEQAQESENRVAAELKRAKRKLTQLEEQISTLSETKILASRLSQENARLKNKIEQLEESNTWQSQDLTRLREVVASQEAAQSALARAQREDDGAAAQAAASLRAAKVEIQKLTEEATTAKAAVDAAHAKATSGVGLIGRLEAELEGMRDEHNRMRTQNEKQAGEAARYQAQAAEAQGELANVKADREDMADRMASLEAAVLRAQSERKAAEADAAARVAVAEKETEIAHLTLQIRELSATEFPVWKTQFLQRQGVDPHVQRVVLQRLDEVEGDLHVTTDRTRKQQQVVDKARSECKRTGDDLAALKKDYIALENSVERYVLYRQREMETVERELTDMDNSISIIGGAGVDLQSATISLPTSSQGYERGLLVERIRELYRHEEGRMKRIMKSMRSVSARQKTANAEAERLREQLSSAEGKCRESTHNAALLQQNLTSAREELKFTSRELEKAREQLSVAEDLRGDLDQRLDLASQGHQESQAALEEAYEHVLRKLEATQDEVAEALRGRNDIAAEYAQFQKARVAVEAEWEQRVIELEHARQAQDLKMVELTHELEDVNDLKTAHSTDLEGTLDRLAKVEVENEALKQTIHEKEMKITALDRDVGRVSAELQVARGSVAQHEALVNKYETTLEAARGEAEISELSALLSSARTDLAAAREETATLRVQCEHVRAECEARVVSEVTVAKRQAEAERDRHNAHHQEEVGRLRSQYNEASQMCSEAKGEVASLRAEIRRLQGSLEESNSELASARRSAEVAQGAQAAAEEQRDTLRAEVASGTRVAAEREAQVSSQVQVLEAAENQLRELQDLVSSYERQLASQTQAAEQYERHIEDLHDKLEEQASLLSEHEQTRRDLVASKASLEGEAKARGVDAEAAQLLNAELKNKLSAVEARLRQAEATHAQAFAASLAERRDVEAQLAAAMHKATVQTSTTRSAEDKFKQYEVRVKDLEMKNKELEDLLVRQDGEVRDMRDREIQASQVERAYKDTLNTVDEQQEVLKYQLDREAILQQELQLARDSRTQVDAELEALQNAVENKETELRDRAEEWEEKQAVYLDDIHSMEDLVRQREDEVARLLAAQNDSRAAVQSLEERAATARLLEQQVAAMTAQISEKAAQHTELDSERAHLRSAVESLQHELAARAEEVAHLKGRSSELERQLEDGRLREAAAGDALDQIAATVEAQEGARGKVEEEARASSAEVARLRNMVLHLEQENRTLTERLAQCNATSEASGHAHEAATTALEKLYKDSQRNAQELQGEIHSLKLRLEDDELRHKRALEGKDEALARVLGEKDLEVQRLTDQHRIDMDQISMQVQAEAASRVESAEAECLRLRAEVAALDKALAVANNDVERSVEHEQASGQHLEGEINVLEMSLHEKHSEVARLTDEVERQRIEMIRLDAQLRAFELDRSQSGSTEHTELTSLRDAVTLRDRELQAKDDELRKIRAQAAAAELRAAESSRESNRGARVTSLVRDTLNRETSTLKLEVVPPSEGSFPTEVATRAMQKDTGELTQSASPPESNNMLSVGAAARLAALTGTNTRIPPGGVQSDHFQQLMRDRRNQHESELAAMRADLEKKKAQIGMFKQRMNIPLPDTA